MRPHRFAWTGACSFTALAFDFADTYQMTNSMLRIKPARPKWPAPPVMRWALAPFTLLFVQPALAALTALPDEDMSTLTALPDEEMGSVYGQGLFFSDKIGGSELVGNNAYSTPFTFYRVGLDGDLAINATIDHLQLGCGGVNDFLSANFGCDIDLEHVSLMGRNPANFQVGNPLSAFTLRRPYLELAIKNDGTANRELVGFKIGAASVDGGLSIGRRYLPGQTNQENMLTTTCTTDSTGNGVGACHSGINSVSGALGLELSLSIYLYATINVIINIDAEGWGCGGRTAMTLDPCGNTRADALFADVAGTRMKNLRLSAVPLSAKLEAIGITLPTLPAYATLVTPLRPIHAITLENSSDFFISFQREPVAYPRYSKMTPVAEMTANGTINTAYDSCAIDQFRSARCVSAYTVPANTGWWLNAPNVKLLDIINPSVVLPGTLSLPEVISLLLTPGLQIDQIELNLSPAKNCYGATRFC